tara:strand:- start:2036 stop:2233 length:198 start_codon:yes stop_codon:yes gene_type:complete
MKGKELLKLSTEELQAKENEIRGELFNTRVKHDTGQLENTARLRSLRREVARIETAIREKREESS